MDYLQASVIHDFQSGLKEPDSCPNEDLLPMDEVVRIFNWGFLHEIKSYEEILEAVRENRLRTAAFLHSTDELIQCLQTSIAQYGNEQLVPALAKKLQSPEGEQMIREVGPFSGVNPNYCICLKSVLTACQYLNLFSSTDMNLPREFACPEGKVFKLSTQDAAKKGKKGSDYYQAKAEGSETKRPSTLYGCTPQRPSFPLGKVYGKFERYPLQEGDSEGGLRTRNIYKSNSSGKPLVTYVTVVYNRVNVLLECMKSVWNQSYDNIEFIVIDGGSTDGTLELIQENADKIDYYVSQPDTGTYNAMNKGIALASGEYLCFINSDDLCLPDAAEVITEIFRETKADVISGRRFLMDKNRCVHAEVKWPRFTLRKCPMVYTYMFHQSLYAGRAAYDKIGFLREDFFIISDFVWEAASLDSDLRVKFIDEPLSIFMQTGASTQHAQIMHREWCDYMREIYPELSHFAAEAIFYSMRPSRWQYNLSALTRCARKYFQNQDFKRAFYQAALLTCIQECVHTLRRREGRFRDLDTKLYKKLGAIGANASSIQTLEAYLSDQLKLICEEKEYAVSDEELSKLCELKRVCDDYRFCVDSRTERNGKKSFLIRCLTGVGLKLKGLGIRAFRSSNWLMIRFLRTRVS